MMSEAELQQRIQIEGPYHACFLLRNNSGAFKDETGRLVRYGLGNVSPKQTLKSSDLIGITTVVVTQDMVGKSIGIFTAIEVKAEGWRGSLTNERERGQNNFIEWVRVRGGIAGFANSLASFKKIFEK